jgi:mannonate dehydratase
VSAPSLSRRQLVVATSFAALYGALRLGRSRLARQPPSRAPLSARTQAFVDALWRGLAPAQVLDVHTHLIGLGHGGTGCEVGPRMQSRLNPMDFAKFSIYLEASGITELQEADQQYLARLLSLMSRQRPHGRLLLMAFDRAYDESGRVLAAETEFYTPNEYALSLAQRYPSYFVACASVHPYRADAVEALNRAVEGGAVAVKWLPNAMNIDPSSAKCDAFYDALARLQVPLISHAGEEKAVHAQERQRLGNPLRLRRALERGVRVVVAHCASLGLNPDLDAPGQPWVENFELFWRLFQQPQWQGRLYGELSAMTLVNRVGHPLQVLLEHPELHHRLVNGSDYPLPAINVLMQTRPIVEKGFITEADREALNELDRHDPLLYDFALKRTVSWKGVRFADGVFMPGTAVFPRLTPMPA